MGNSEMKTDRINRKRRTLNRYCSYCHSWVTKKAWTLSDGLCPKCHGPLVDPYQPDTGNRQEVTDASHGQ